MASTRSLIPPSPPYVVVVCVLLLIFQIFFVKKLRKVFRWQLYDVGHQLLARDYECALNPFLELLDLDLVSCWHQV